MVQFSASTRLPSSPDVYAEEEVEVSSQEGREEKGHVRVCVCVCVFVHDLLPLEQ
jgi:hypothetical protein